MNGRRLTLACIGLAIVAVAAWWWWPGEKANVRRQLNALAHEVNSVALDSASLAARTMRIGSFFTEEVEMNLGPGSAPIHGREMLLGMAERLQPRTAAFRLRFDDVIVNLASDSLRARVDLTAVLTRRGGGSGDRSLDAMEFSLQMEKVEGQWRIARVTAVETIR